MISVRVRSVYSLLAEESLSKILTVLHAESAHMQKVVMARVMRADIANRLLHTTIKIIYQPTRPTVVLILSVFPLSSHMLKKPILPPDLKVIHYSYDRNQS